MTRTLAVLALAVAAVVAAAVPSLAATPIVVGQAEQGGAPDIAVDGSGTAHIAWLDTQTSPEQAEYVQLPRGGSSSINFEAFPGSQPTDPDSAFDRAHVFLPSASEVVVGHYRCCGGVGEGSQASRSIDGGLNFAARSVFGDSGFAEGVYGPGSSITTLTEVATFGSEVQNGPVPGAKQTTSTDLGDISAEGAIALDAAGRPVAVYQVQDTNWRLAWRKLSDLVPPTTANINNGANWTPEAVISNERINAANGPAMASGPNGVFLFWQQRLPDAGYVSKFTGSGWTAPVQIVGDQSFNDHDIFQDSAGRLHAVWNAYSAEALRYRFSDDGVNWSPTVDIARGEGYRDVRVSAAPDHQGFAVWNRSGPDVVAVPLEALPAPGGPGGADTAGPSVSGFGASDTTLRPGQGTTFSFISSEAGSAVLTIDKRVPGLRLRQRGRTRCLVQTRRRLRSLRRSLGRRRDVRRLRGRARRRRVNRLVRRRRCRAWRKVGEIRQPVTPGRNTIVFSGRVAGRRLSPGTYRARLVVRDRAGNVSRTETLIFRVLRPRRR